MTAVIKIKRSETASSVPTTSDLEVGEVAVNTADQKIYMRDSSDTIVTIADVGSGGGGSGSAFTKIAVSGETTVTADSSTDTLTLVGSGLNNITTNATTDTITIGNNTSIPFTKADGTTQGLELNADQGTLSTIVDNLYIPFTKADGTSQSTLKMTS